MTRIIVYEILSAVFLNLLYTSIYSDGSRLYPAVNPLVGKSFKLVCNTEVTIVSTVTIKFPDGTVAGTCDPASPPVSVDCSGAVGYVSALNETENTVTISTNSLAADVSGTWTCTYTNETVSYTLTAPIRAIADESFILFPASFTDNITSETTSISLSATYKCINLPVDFQWFLVDSASTRIDISGTNNAAENSSVCTSGFNGYTETKDKNEDVYSSNYVKNLDGSYRLGVEVHYMDEVTTLHSIKYFDTYFVFNTTTTTETTTMETNDGSKDFEINIIIGTVLGACVLIVI